MFPRGSLLRSGKAVDKIEVMNLKKLQFDAIPRSYEYGQYDFILNFRLLVVPPNRKLFD